MKCIACWLKYATLLMFSSEAFAIDLQPGEARAVEPGINFMQLSYQHSSRGDRYIDGQKQKSNPKLDTTQYQLRLGRTFKVKDHTAVFYVQAPVYAHTNPSGTLTNVEDDKGAGDTSFLLAAWPYVNHETESYFVVGGYLTVPTGSYDNHRLINIGENRYKTAIQGAFQQRLFKNTHYYVSLDAVKFGENDDFGNKSVTLAQRSLYSAQGGLLYEFDAMYSFGAAYFYTVGGENILNDVHLDDRMRLQRYQLTANATLSTGRITLQYGGDIKTENGFFEDSRWIVRYTARF